MRSAGKLRAFQGFLEFLLGFFPLSFQNYFFPTAQLVFISNESLTLPASSPHSFPQLSTASSETRTLMRGKYYRDISEENPGFEITLRAYKLVIVCIRYLPLFLYFVPRNLRHTLLLVTELSCWGFDSTTRQGPHSKETMHPAQPVPSNCL